MIRDILKNRPQVTAKKFKKFLNFLGYHKVSQKGSHIKYKKHNYTYTYANKPNTYIYKKGSLMKMLKDINVSLEELFDFLL